MNKYIEYHIVYDDESDKCIQFRCNTVKRFRKYTQKNIDKPFNGAWKTVYTKSGAKTSKVLRKFVKKII